MSLLWEVKSGWNGPSCEAARFSLLECILARVEELFVECVGMYALPSD